MTADYEPTPNLIVDITTDPNLAKSFFSKLEDSDYKIPEKEIIKEIKSLKGLRSITPQRLVSRVSGLDDYQTQLTILSQIQSLQDRLHEVKMDLAGYQANWNELSELATNYVNKKWFTELAGLKNEATKKAVFSAALQPIQRGLARIEMLISIADDTMKHLDRTNWNVKEANSLITEYLAPLKYPVKATI